MLGFFLMKKPLSTRRVELYSTNVLFIRQLQQKLNKGITKNIFFKAWPSYGMLRQMHTRSDERMHPPAQAAKLKQHLRTKLHLTLAVTLMLAWDFSPYKRHFIQGKGTRAYIWMPIAFTCVSLMRLCAVCMADEWCWWVPAVCQLSKRLLYSARPLRLTYYFGLVTLSVLIGNGEGWLHVCKCT